MDFTVIAVLITAAASLITALAAISAPVIAQLISQHGAYKLKTIELFFEAKAKVFHDFVQVTSRFPPNPDYETLQKLNDSMNQALLYCSKDTGWKIALYVKYLKDSPGSDLDELADAHLNAILAMQGELKQYHK